MLYLASFGAVICGLVLYGSAPSEHQSHNHESKSQSIKKEANSTLNENSNNNENDETRKLVDQS